MNSCLGNAKTWKVCSVIFIDSLLEEFVIQKPYVCQENEKWEIEGISKTLVDVTNKISIFVQRSSIVHAERNPRCSRLFRFLKSSHCSLGLYRLADFSNE